MSIWPSLSNGVTRYERVWKPEGSRLYERQTRPTSREDDGEPEKHSDTSIAGLER